MKRFFSLLALSVLLFSCNDDNPSVVEPEKTFVNSCTINSTSVKNKGSIYNVDLEGVEISVVFDADIDMTKLPEKQEIMLQGGGKNVAFEPQVSDNPKELRLKVTGKLSPFTSYKFFIVKSEILGIKLMEGFSCTFVTVMDETPKFPEISDEELLTKVQEYTFKYFWDYGHPVSGLARERLGSGNTVTSGGSGFGIMTIPVGIERGFITRAEGAERMLKIVSFLETAETFHGAYPHWLNGETGKAIAFSTKDNGADLVETAFLIEGLLTVQQYFDGKDAVEVSIREKCEKIWRAVEWSWFTKDGAEKALYWHWSPNYGWDMNMKIEGWNEGLIVYVLAASSPTHPVSKDVYDNGWARGGAMKNDYRGPLFFTHYSFLGLNPKGLSDAYGNYWDMNVAQAEYNHQYCIDNPRKYYGYSAKCWGLTACDYPKGYTASSPANDTGTIAPTAALASMPYTPEESMAALRYFYYVLGDKLWGEYGFKDSFNLSSQWFATSYIAIDQGPIVIMIENHRTALLWNNFMKNTDVRKGLTKLGFTF